MTRNQSNRVINLLAVLGAATLLVALVASTMRWVDPFLSTTHNGTPTIFGRILVYGIYFGEALAGILVAWLAVLAVFALFPKRNLKAHVRDIPIQAAQNITGRTHGIN